MCLPEATTGSGLVWAPHHRYSTGGLRACIPVLSTALVRKEPLNKSSASTTGQTVKASLMEGPLAKSYQLNSGLNKLYPVFLPCHIPCTTEGG